MPATTSDQVACRFTKEITSQDSETCEYCNRLEINPCLPAMERTREQVESINEKEASHGN